MAKKSPTPFAPGVGRRIETRRSGVHGKGVFAIQDIPEGEDIVEYKGEVITWKEALRRHPHDPSDPNHTFYFHIDDKHVIDGKVNGNSARWINHACDPNCEADEREGRVFVKALRNIAAGEELNYDYGLIIDEPYTEELLAQFPCWCGSSQCRGTLLAPKEDEGAGKKNKKAKAEKKSEKKSEKRSGRKSDAKKKADAKKSGKRKKRDKKD